MAIPSDDADGDTVSVTKVVFTNVNEQVETKTLTGTWNQIYTKYGLLSINTNGDYVFDASRTSSDYDAGTQGLSANISSFNRVNELDAGDTVTETFTYTL